MSITLGIMAAGIGSRFKDGCKQLTPVGPAGEVIMEYSINDALEAGFDHIVFIIREALRDDFEVQIGSKLEGRCKVDYAVQDMDNLPGSFKKPADRTKPWGTGHAVLAMKDVIDGPFAVINADDYYGKEAFKNVHDFLVKMQDKPHASDYCMPGFVLGNTLSDHGTVTRGICEMDENRYLMQVMETKNIEKRENGVFSGERKVDENGLVSMNMWGLNPGFMKILEEEFSFFLSLISEGDITSEFLLPEIIAKLLREKRAPVKVLKTDAHWFGLTYKEDTPLVKDALAKMTENGTYGTPLFS